MSALFDAFMKASDGNPLLAFAVMMPEVKRRGYVFRRTPSWDAPGLWLFRPDGTPAIRIPAGSSPELFEQVLGLARANGVLDEAS